MQWKHSCFIIIGLFVTSSVYASNQPMPWPNKSAISKNEAGTTKTALNQAKQIGTSYLNNHLQHTISKWFTRTDINYAVQEDHKPVGSIETIQPLYLNTKHTAFWQGRLAYSGSETTGNIGLGYRYLTDSKRFMWGVNTFYDQNITRSHKRLGIGGEAYTPYLAFRANYYDALSGSRQVGSNTERALDGYDGSIETPVPFIPWTRFKAEGYHWDGINAANVNGGIALLRVFPTRHLEVDLGVAHDNSLGRQAFLQLDYYLGAPAFIQSSATTSHFVKNFVPLDLEDLRLQKVFRHNDIVVEKSSSTSTGGIIIARGT